ncbi:homeo [Trichoderma arundinaceum]|uniref:Homeo n=1 Tax=Trichoderma arundinaceum TaxID=490622 RepID=A0A395NGF6_TRIAR|nr:homeo [Trichoderma arundinaceum]
MNSWDFRVEHLAQHFKNGKSMADWKGDWGFPEEVLRVVENGMPPYLIHHERNTLDPYEASKDEVRHGKTLEDHVKLWLTDYINDRAVAGVSTTDAQLLIEAQRIVQKVDTEDTSPTGPDISWFRDLIMLCRVSPNTPHKVEYQGSRETANSVAWSTQIEKMKTSQSAQCGLSIIGCEKEKILMKYVKFMQASGQTPTDFDLQIQSCKAIEDVEPKSNFKCKEAVQWFKFLINSSTNWLTEFKRRAGLPQCPKQMIEHVQLAGDEIMNNSLYHPWGFQNDSVAESHVQENSVQTVLREQVQHQPYIRVYGDDVSRIQILDELSDLSTSEGCDSLRIPHQDILLAASEGSELFSAHPLKDSKPNTTHSSQTLHWGLPDEAIGCASSMNTDQYLSAPFASKSLHTNSQNLPLRYFLSDVNCYGRLEKELTRFVTSCLSPNNPLQHVPSDEEIQHQARWIIYDDDDPWNQTAADNAEWLARFKRDAGLISDGERGLAPVGPPRPWRVKDGGTGFQPPFLKPKAGKQIGFTEDASVYIDNLPYSYQFPASVFCSRELEEGLNIYIEECILALYVPTDDDLRAKAREILGVEHTAADDEKLLNAFKAMHALWPTHANGNHEPILADTNHNAADFQGGMDTVVPNTQQSITMDLTAQFSARLGA